MLRLLALVLAAVLPAPVATETPQPDNSGQLAPLQFVVRAPEGLGTARYFANGSLEGSAVATRAVIVVHGVLRDADYYFQTAMESARDAGDRNALVIAPQFVEAADLAGHNAPDSTLRWSGQWPGGAAAEAPAPISTYAVFDAMIHRLSDRKRFPAMREIVVVGHSAGGQIVQRYAAVGKARELDGGPVRVHLVVANPSSYLYFSDGRPVPQSHCPDFNHWRYGFIGTLPYVNENARYYEAQYVRRNVTYLLGTADTNPNEDDLDRTCGGESQGAFRFVRGKNYIAYLQRRHGNHTNQDYAFVRGVPHDNRRMFRSACGRGVIFGGSRSACAATGKL